MADLTSGARDDQMPTMDGLDPIPSDHMSQFGARHKANVLEHLTRCDRAFGAAGQFTDE